MSEAKQLYDDLLSALSPILPRTVYQDVRRVRTLAWAITGLCLSHSVQLSAWAEVAQSRTHNAARRVRRFSRWLHHPAIVPAQWYRPVIQAALSGWPVDQRLFIALDTTALTPFVLIRACLVYRGRAIPLAWRAMRHRSTKGSVLKPISLCSIRFVLSCPQDIGSHCWLTAALCMSDCSTTCESTSGTVACACQATPWSICRLSRSLPSETCVPRHGESRFFQKVSILGAAVGPVSLALACLLDQPDDPWFVVSDEPTDAKTLDEYGLRFDIEETFRDEKSGGYQLQTSRLATPDALERLVLILALTTLYLTSLGTAVVQADKWRWVDPHWERGLSYLQLGWRWRRQQTQRGWQGFAPFQLDPAPDPLPLLAPRRVGSRESNEGDLSAAA
jgi:hypothetical protein